MSARRLTLALVAALLLGALTSGVARGDAALPGTELEAPPEQVLVESFGLEDLDDELAVVSGQRIKLRETILFHFAKVSIRAESFATLDRVADLLKSMPEIEAVSIEGHTDAIGKPGYNRELSRARAQAVEAYLVSRGVSAERLSSVGHGETLPVASNQTKEGLQANRRVEFVLRTVDGAPLPEPTDEPAQAVVVQLTGEGWRYVDRERRASLRVWSALLQGAALETGFGGNLTLRLPDLGRLTMRAETRVKLVRLEWQEDARKLAAKLVAGRVELLDRAGAEAVIVSQEGSLHLRGARASVERRGGALTVALYEGTGTFELRDRTVALAAGHAWRFDREGSVVELGALPPAPRRLAPVDGVVTPDTVLTWDGAGSAHVIELARDAQFVEWLGAVEVNGASMRLGDLPKGGAGERLYVRVRALGAGGVASEPSELRELIAGE